MANLKELRKKIGVVQSTRKVTAAMKMVAGVKLRKIEQQVAVSREYAQGLYDVLARLQGGFTDIEDPLFSGRPNVQTELVIVFVSERGLCGNYNYMINKEMRAYVSEIHKQNKQLHIECVGIKLFEQFKQLLNENDSIELIDDFYHMDSMFEKAQALAEKVVEKFEKEEVDKVSILYTRYDSAMKHTITLKILIPLQRSTEKTAPATIFEPDIKTVLRKVLPYNIGLQIYETAMESMSSEQSARMTAMDSATRNADDLLSELTTRYNRTRQYGITQELTEVISGAQAINEE